ncbi:hypothetical protein NL676_025637 [Syzygium grande]|nr:hypothetical protein NL676_025637 [Syzygium grande]
MQAQVAQLLFLLSPVSLSHPHLISETLLLHAQDLLELLPHLPPLVDLLLERVRLLTLVPKLSPSLLPWPQQLRQELHMLTQSTASCSNSHQNQTLSPARPKIKTQSKYLHYKQFEIDSNALPKLVKGHHALGHKGPRQGRHGLPAVGLVVSTVWPGEGGLANREKPFHHRGQGLCHLARAGEAVIASPRAFAATGKATLLDLARVLPNREPSLRLAADEAAAGGSSKGVRVK